MPVPPNAPCGACLNSCNDFPPVRYKELAMRHWLRWLAGKGREESRRKASRPSMPRLRLEPLERREVLTVSAFDITSITSTADTDGIATDEHVRVVAGTTVTVNFSYSSSGGQPTTAAIDINTSPVNVSTGTVSVPSGDSQTQSLSLII